MSIEKWENIDDLINEEERKKAKGEASKKVLKDNFAENTPLNGRFEKLREEIVEDKESNDEDEKPLPEEAEKLISLRWENLTRALREYKRIEDEIVKDKTILRWEKGEERKKDSRGISTRTELTDRIKEGIDSKEREKEELKDSTPEAYVGLNLQEFKEQANRAKKGYLVETDYVKKMKDWSSRKMEEGEHIFLHGHLGAGKTDFAMEVATERMIDLNVNKEIDQWSKENSDASEKEFVKKYNEIKKKYKKGLEESDPEIINKIRPFLVAGSKDFNLQDLYAEKSLRVTKFNGQSVSEHSQAIETEVEKWKKDNEKRLLELSEGQRVVEEERERIKILELYKMKNTGFGTEVEKIKKEMYRAVEEGKPIIIDEANTIPPSLLVSMNDILTSKPGDMAYIPGEDPVKVKEGFNVIMTGNLEGSGLAEYTGTQEMNPAFLSRLNVREYDYLPQNKAGNAFEQNEPEKNEMFYTVMAFLANNDGSLSVPEGSLDKIFKLCQLAKVSQDVFSRKWKESEVRTESSGDEAIEPKLEKSVLSLRAIIETLKEWNKGQEKDIDKALWDSFISATTIPEDQNFLLNEAKKFGFFLETDGWNIKPSEDKSSLLSEEDARSREYNYFTPENHHHSKRDLIQMVYGNAPRRVNFPDVNLEAFSEKEIDLEKISQWEELNKEIGKYEKAFKVTIEKECPLEED